MRWVGVGVYMRGEDVAAVCGARREEGVKGGWGSRVVWGEVFKSLSPSAPLCDVCVLLAVCAAQGMLESVDKDVIRKGAKGKVRRGTREEGTARQREGGLLCVVVVQVDTLPKFLCCVLCWLQGAWE